MHNVPAALSKLIFYVNLVPNLIPTNFSGYMAYCVHSVCHLSGELPVIIDFTRFDHDPGEHNFTVVANSTIGEVANYTYTFYATSM